MRPTKEVAAKENFRTFQGKPKHRRKPASFIDKVINFNYCSNEMENVIT